MIKLTILPILACLCSIQIYGQIDSAEFSDFLQKAREASIKKNWSVAIENYTLVLDSSKSLLTIEKCEILDSLRMVQGMYVLSLKNEKKELTARIEKELIEIAKKEAYLKEHKTHDYRLLETRRKIKEAVQRTRLEMEYIAKAERSLLVEALGGEENNIKYLNKGKKDLLKQSKIKNKNYSLAVESFAIANLINPNEECRRWYQFSIDLCLFESYLKEKEYSKAKEIATKIKRLVPPETYYNNLIDKQLRKRI